MKNKLLLIISIFHSLLSFSQKNFCSGEIIYPQEDYNICNSNPWVVVFEDDFETFNRKTWNQWAFNDIPCYETQQYYAFGDNTFVENGILKIWGEEVEPFWSKVDLNKPKTAIISCGDDGEFVNWQKFSYKLDKIETRKTFSYGKFEARVKFSVGNGAWPAFWLWQADGPNEENYREIDIVEIMKNKFSKYRMNVQYNYNDEGRKQCPFNVDLDGLCNNWHVLGMTYEKDYIIWYVDYEEVGRLRHYYTSSGQEIGCELNGWTPYLMNKIYPRGEEMNVQINLAIYDDGTYGPYDDFYETVEVDWVKIYNRSNLNDVIVYNQDDYPIIDGKYNTILGHDITFDCNYNIPDEEFLRIQADNSIHILPGFETNRNSELQLLVVKSSDENKHSYSCVKNNDLESVKKHEEFNAKKLIKNSFNISPNPTSGEFTLNIENIANSQIKIVNYRGDVVYKNNEVKTRFILLDLTFLQSGVYLVLLSNQESDFIESKKLIIL